MTAPRGHNPRGRRMLRRIALLPLALCLLAGAPCTGRADDPPVETEGAPPGGFGEEVVVTATRVARPVDQVASTVTVIGREQIDVSPTKTADELLRSDPSFGLFRRSSSVAADPSSQGVKLRNVGGSGVSRALVLMDGIPVNDPYAGWVPWRSIPRIGLERIELVPGGGSALYGNYALGGVIQAFSRPILAQDVEATAEYGSFNTAQIAGRVTDRWGAVGAEVEGELFRSDGYDVVAPYARGAIDHDTPSKHATARARVETQLTPQLSLDARGGFFYEDWNGGTQYTTAMVRKFDYALGAHYRPAAVGSLDVTVFGHHGAFLQERARVSADRNSEALSAHQTVPTDDVGGSVVWTSRPLRLAGTHTLVAGTDVRWVKGSTLETLYAATASPPPATVVERDADGRQWLLGVFAQELYELSDRLGGSLALRYDRWENLPASRVETTFGGAVNPVGFADRSGGELSPKLAARARIDDWLSARAAVYRSFRAPTLDELYRPFQVGTIRTDANPTLTPETMQGGEFGFDLGSRRLLGARVTVFFDELRDPIVNVTTGPNTRQRRNLGRASIQGFQADAQWRFFPGWTLALGFMLAATDITDAPGQPQLLHKELPQSPAQQGTASLTYDDPRLLSATVQLRGIGKQYEDDVNQLPMREALLLDLFVSVPVTRWFEIYGAVENVLDETYLVGRSGVDTIGQPRFIHGGIRFHGGG